MHDEKYFEGLNLPYNIQEIPDWCMLHPIEHACAGGCWSIKFAQVDIFTKCSNCESSKYFILKNAIKLHDNQLAEELKKIIN